MTSSPFCWEAATSGKVGLDNLRGVSQSLIPWRQSGPSDFLQERCARVWIEQKQEDTKGRAKEKGMGGKVNHGGWGGGWEREVKPVNKHKSRLGWMDDFIPPQECCEVHRMWLLEAAWELPRTGMILFPNLLWKWQESHRVHPMFTAIHYPVNALFWNVLRSEKEIQYLVSNICNKCWSISSCLRGTERGFI